MEANMEKLTLRNIEPKHSSFQKKLSTNRTFLLSLINNPKATFIEYRYDGDKKLISNIEAVANNIKNQSWDLLKELGLDESLISDRNNAFLIDLLADVPKALAKYGVIIEDSKIPNFEGATEAILSRAYLLFEEIGFSPDGDFNPTAITDGCRACEGCRACQLCTHATIPTFMTEV